MNICVTSPLPWGVSAGGGISPPADVLMTVPREGWGSPAAYHWGHPFLLMLPGIFALLCGLLLFFFLYPPSHSFAAAFLLLAGAVSRALRKDSVLLAKSSSAKNSHRERR